MAVNTLQKTHKASREKNVLTRNSHDTPEGTPAKAQVAEDFTKTHLCSGTSSQGRRKRPPEKRARQQAPTQRLNERSLQSGRAQKQAAAEQSGAKGMRDHDVRDYINA